MPRFLHHPTQKIIETDNHSQVLRYRRSSRFQELQPTPESPETHRIAPDAPEPEDLDPYTTDIHNHTVSQVLAWVDNNPTRARQALQAEQAGRNRVTLLTALRRIQ